MDTASKPTNSPGHRDGRPLTPTSKRRLHRPTKIQLLTRAALDGRTNAAKEFDRLVRSIEADLAGPDQLSAIERTLIEAFAGSAISLFNLNTRLALGEAIDISEHAACVGAMVRVASRLGLRRRSRDVTTPDLEAYLHLKQVVADD